VGGGAEVTASSENTAFVVATAAELARLFKRLYQEYEDHEVANSAATLSYYFIFSL
jgi:uncharacterized BrkB/YihY/UPF0761 family membrane protein